MVRRSASLAGALAVLALASCGEEEEEGEVSGPASFAPADAPLYVEASRESDEQVANVEALIAEVGEVPLLGSALDPRDLIAGAIDAAAADEGVEITFAEDIEPWLGDSAGVAFTSLDDLISEAEADGAAEEAPPGFVAALEVSDEAAAEESVDGLLGTDGSVEVTEAEIDGVTVRRPEGEEGGIAVTDGFLVFGSTDDSLERAFAARDDESLADSEEFTGALEGLAAERVGLAYLDVGRILEEGVAAGEIDPVELEAVRGLYGDGFDRPITATLSALERAVVLDLAGASAVVQSPPRLGATELVPDAPANAFAAVGATDVGSQIESFVDFAEASGELFGEPEVGPGTISEGFEAEVGVPLDAVIAAAGDAAVHVRGELPDDFVIGAELTLGEDGLPSQVYDFVGEELRAAGFALGPPLDRSGSGFSAENPSASPTSIGFVDVAIEPGSAAVTLAPSREAAEATPPEGETLGDQELFGAATDALGPDFPLAGFADLDPILDGTVGDSSLLDIATGQATPEQAIGGFLADKLGFAALGVREDGDGTVQRIVVGLD